MPNRFIKETICTSDSIDMLSPFEEVFFYRLLVNCDDFGRFDARPKVLSARLFPLREITIREIESALQALVRAGLVILYEVEGKPYIQVSTWSKHQQTRAAKSKYPAPDSDGYQPIAKDSTSPSIRKTNSYSDNVNDSASDISGTVETPFGDVSPDPLIVKVQKELSGLTDTHYDLLGQYRDSLGDELISYAIDQAVANGVRKWIYVERILQSMEERGIKTVGDAKAEDERRRKGKSSAQQYLDDRGLEDWGIGNVSGG